MSIKGTVVVKLKVDNEKTTSINQYHLALSATIQLIKSNEADSSGKGKLLNTTYVRGVLDDKDIPPSADKQYSFITNFDYDKDFGIPGAFYIKNKFKTEFFLVSLTLEDIPNLENIQFVCNSWIYNEDVYESARIFFANNTYLPSETPSPLVYYRQLELQTLRGELRRYETQKFKEWERIYDYDIYNDLGDPDNGESRPSAGGSSAVPYPRRGKTGRRPAYRDPKCESPTSSYVYVPRDETYKLETVSENAAKEDELQDFNDFFEIHNQDFPPPKVVKDEEFESFNDVFDLYKEDFPLPAVAKVNKFGCMTDDEFAREILAGVNPVLIRCVQDMPPKIKLNVANKKLFLLDHHEIVMPYLRRINSTHAKVYATKTYLVLENDGTLKPVAIELSLPHPEGDQFGAFTAMYFPATGDTIEGYLWQLAKAYVIVNDTCYHQLISHWLNTHAVVEPFIIATNRQLSVVHPIHKLLHPHFRDTMHINALSRWLYVCAGGGVEQTLAWGKYGVEMTSIMYKDWIFPEQALPADLIKRGMAVEDPTSPHGLRLVIEDYPYAVDGLDIWGAIKTWVQEYIPLYYKSDDVIQQDSELQSWWKEVVEVGHGDKKNEKWWPKMQTREELIQVCVIIIWTASALHGAVNSGQYEYGGLILNRPTLSRQFMPTKNSLKDLNQKKFEKIFLKTITPKNRTMVDLNILERGTTHPSDEYYLGQRASAESWTSDTKALEAFKKFGTTLAGIGDKIVERNNDITLKNRAGLVSMPYTLLYPTPNNGIPLTGVPNSISM